jgi:hypothetical protein
VNKLSSPHVGSGPAQIGPAVLGLAMLFCLAQARFAARRLHRARAMGFAVFKAIRRSR